MVQLAMAHKTRDRTQFAALPCRIGAHGQPEVLLLTSRETRRWVIPKGWPIKGLKPREVAVREAYEEAGLQGTISGKHPLGVYHYEKQLPGEQLLCEVQVFLFWVTGQHEEWPEKGQREALWLSAAEAAALVDEGSLAELLRYAIVPTKPRQLKRRARARIAEALLPRGLR
jgi:8-oxo-dGTP pyrophosphatase MutT (NUDIX family)